LVVACNWLHKVAKFKLDATKLQVSCLLVAVGVSQSNQEATQLQANKIAA
jgi:hypothetical protein